MEGVVEAVDGSEYLGFPFEEVARSLEEIWQETEETPPYLWEFENIE